MNSSGNTSLPGFHLVCAGCFWRFFQYSLWMFFIIYEKYRFFISDKHPTSLTEEKQNKTKNTNKNNQQGALLIFRFSDNHPAYMGKTLDITFQYWKSSLGLLLQRIWGCFLYSLIDQSDCRKSRTRYLKNSEKKEATSFSGWS